MDFVSVSYFKYEAWKKSRREQSGQNTETLLKIIS